MDKNDYSYDCQELPVKNSNPVIYKLKCMLNKIFNSIDMNEEMFRKLLNEHGYRRCDVESNDYPICFKKRYKIKGDILFLDNEISKIFNHFKYIFINGNWVKIGEEKKPYKFNIKKSLINYKNDPLKRKQASNKIISENLDKTEFEKYMTDYSQESDLSDVENKVDSKKPSLGVKPPGKQVYDPKTDKIYKF